MGKKDRKKGGDDWEDEMGTAAEVKKKPVDDEVDEVKRKVKTRGGKKAEAEEGEADAEAAEEVDIGKQREREKKEAARNKEEARKEAARNVEKAKVGQQARGEG